MMNMLKLSEKNMELKLSTAEDLSENSNRFLKSEDRILWETVARTTRPLRPIAPKRTGIIEDMYLWDIENGFNIVERVQPQASAEKTTKPALNQSVHLNAEPVLPNDNKRIKSANTLHDIDRPTIRKIAKGRLEIQARIDLHGMRQHEAHDLLYGFLADAWHRGLRFVLVITGKGSSSGSEGILKQAVPQWFSKPLFRIYVSAYEDAVRHHGGQGALYVRLRKTSAEKLAESNSLTSGKGRQL